MLHNQFSLEMQESVKKHIQEKTQLLSQRPEMLDSGFLALGRFYSILAHTVDAAKQYVRDASRIFLEFSGLIRTDQLEKSLRSDITYGEYQRLN